jgi:hypothetical protein
MNKISKLQSVFIICGLLFSIYGVRNQVNFQALYILI